MTFDDWLENKRPLFEEMFSKTSWPAIHTFLREVYEVGYSSGYRQAELEFSTWDLRE